MSATTISTAGICQGYSPEFIDQLFSITKHGVCVSVSVCMVGTALIINIIEVARSLLKLSISQLISQPSSMA